mmetsp:Transcript_857/g.1321  ORF Transcript_857/g.1321 Transcript_857/m.1321 type:complete len:198 (+) Transcript_857:122-715(+)|eukprot:CAMPEP_0184864092 /NCGR_PEP_ID=MMETSP0580-20130426/13741_1 /TAXON_ID=1118495 /ORGANISM="Dactyliosolen fragilissimus" /LENGTH=197 /DNA_ID=CAMNT_0027362739 /DNA_START=25 /DNA_END=618 /DNA_ORIENTATION=+
MTKHPETQAVHEINRPPPFNPHHFQEDYDIEVPPSSPHNEVSNNNSDDTKSKSSAKGVGGAALLGGTAGMCILGPIGLVAGGASAATLALTSGKGGQIARKSGETVINTGQNVKRFGQKHEVGQKTKNAMVKVSDGAKKIEEKTHIVENTKKVTGKVIGGAKKFDEKHHIVDKTKQGFKTSIQFVKSKVNKTEKPNQ